MGYPLYFLKYFSMKETKEILYGIFHSFSGRQTQESNWAANSLAHRPWMAHFQHGVLHSTPQSLAVALRSPNNKRTLSPKEVPGLGNNTDGNLLQEKGKLSAQRSDTWFIMHIYISSFGTGESRCTRCSFSWLLLSSYRGSASRQHMHRILSEWPDVAVGDIIL